MGLVCITFALYLHYLYYLYVCIIFALHYLEITYRFHNFFASPSRLITNCDAIKLTDGTQWCKSLLSIGGDNLQFYPNFALFSTLGGMNLDQDFFQVRKLSEDQKKKKTVFTRNGTLFSPNSGEDQKKISDAHQSTRVKVLEGMQMKTILKLLGGRQSNFLEDISPHPPLVSAPLMVLVQSL